MRLLKYENSTLSLIGDNNHITQPYAILSHTWGRNDEEVTFQEMAAGEATLKAGYKKILFCAQQAARDNLEYCWVDTCCIDKFNGTELQKSINSMFRWYRDSAKCYVFLADVASNDNDKPGNLSPATQTALRSSHWFTRGWTVQELIAPSCVEFYDSNGKLLGDKTSLEHLLHEITKISIRALRKPAELATFTVKERMSWIEHRNTREEEDKAYCLLGIFGVNMPLIYGEVREKLSPDSSTCTPAPTRSVSGTFIQQYSMKG